MKTRKAKHNSTPIFKISSGVAPPYLIDKFSKVEARNPYNIRNRGLNINLKLPKTDFMKRSFAYAGPNCGIRWLTKSAKSLADFKKGLEDLDFDVLLLIDSIVPLLIFHTFCYSVLHF